MYFIRPDLPCGRCVYSRKIRDSRSPDKITDFEEIGTSSTTSAH
jgi:hypothetical protein